MFEEAKGLLEPGEERDNPEYLRGMCNLIASCFGKEGMPTDERSQEIEKQLITENAFNSRLCINRPEDLQPTIELINQLNKLKISAGIEDGDFFILNPETGEEVTQVGDFVVCNTGSGRPRFDVDAAGRVSVAFRYPNSATTLLWATYRKGVWS